MPRRDFAAERLPDARFPGGGLRGVFGLSSGSTKVWRGQLSFSGQVIGGKLRADNRRPVGEQRHIGETLFGQNLARDFWQEAAYGARAFSGSGCFGHELFLIACLLMG